jgi:octaprenyl-diphosphate synthase
MMMCRTVIAEGVFSINALWKIKFGGDYLLSKGLLLSIDGDFDLLKIISIAVREMSEGELLQIEKARRLDITEDIYYEIIEKNSNTYCCLLCTGAKSVIEDEVQENMRKFGELIGMAFKLKMICLIIQRKLSGNQLVLI